MSMEILIKIEAPDLTASLNNLAAAMYGNRAILTPAPAAPTKGKKQPDVAPKAELVAEVKVETITPAVEETPDPLITEEIHEAEEVAYTLVQVREKLASLSQAGKQAAVKALITKLGAEKLSAVPEEKYAELMKEAEAL